MGWSDAVVSREHKRPMLAFVTVAVVCGVLLINAARSNAVEILRGPLPAAAMAAPLRLIPGVQVAAAPRPADPAVAGVESTSEPGESPEQPATSAAEPPDRVDSRSGRRHRDARAGHGAASGPAQTVRSGHSGAPGRRHSSPAGEAGRHQDDDDRERSDGDRGDDHGDRDRDPDAGRYDDWRDREHDDIRGHGDRDRDRDRGDRDRDDRDRDRDRDRGDHSEHGHR